MKTWVSDERRDRIQEIVNNRQPKPKVITIHLPPPPEYRFVWIGSFGLVIYEN